MRPMTFKEYIPGRRITSTAQVKGERWPRIKPSEPFDERILAEASDWIRERRENHKETES